MTVQRRTLLSLAALSPLAGMAQAFPTRPVKIIVNFAAGGPLDVMARVLAEELQKRVGQPVVVDNITGANGNLGVQALMRAEPDGHTLLFTAENAITVSPHLYAKLGHDPLADMTPVRLVGAFEQVLTVPAGSGVRTVDDLVRKAKQSKLTYASAGSGSPGHLAFVAFAERGGIQATHVPYRGNAPAVNDLLAGHVDAAFVVIGGVRPHLQSGKLVALAVSGRQRSPELPDVPTLEQAGFPGFSLSYGYVITVPKATPAAAQSYWQEQIRQALNAPALIERYRKLDTRMINSEGAAARSWLAQSSARWKTTLANGQVKVD
ncbi:MAG: Bug family tripartite tricarboxylate transporter substrate binding protein [Ramlibacter sp.]